MDHAAALRHLPRADPKLGALIARVGACGLKPRKAGTHFEALARAICGQQVTGHVAQLIFGRVKALGTGGRFPSAEEVLLLGEARLKGAGLSRQKTAAMLDLAAKVSAGHVRLHALARLEDAQVVESLTQVRGIGPWTAEILLMFRLGRPDVLPATDYGVQKGLMLLDGMKTMPKPAQVLERGEQWRPFRSAAAWYLWRMCEL